MSFLSRLHTELRITRLTRRGATQRNDTPLQGTHKEYPRMERIALPEPATIPMSLTDALSARQSTIEKHQGLPLSLEDISAVLGHGLRKRSKQNTRNYPSGGQLYPIETYLIATEISGARSGVYHYHPTAHALERLWDLPNAFEVDQLIDNNRYLPPTLILLFTSVWARSSIKYGDLTYLHALLETGHMSENVLLLASALGLEARPMAGFNDDLATELLDLKPEQEQPVHSIILARST